LFDAGLATAAEGGAAHWRGAWRRTRRDTRDAPAFRKGAGVGGGQASVSMKEQSPFAEN